MGAGAKKWGDWYQPSLFESESPQFDAGKTGVRGKIFVLDHDANARRIWKFAEMDADHVTAWSKGGATDISNCQMLCRTHNRAKGNR